MNRIFKRTLSLILAVLMIFGTAPQTAFALLREETESCKKVYENNPPKIQKSGCFIFLKVIQSNRL